MSMLKDRCEEITQRQHSEIQKRKWEKKTNVDKYRGSDLEGEMKNFNIT